MATPQLLFLMLTFFTHLWPCFQYSFNITHLPGFSGELPFRLETGYVNMDEESGAELFYYFVESERNPSEDPLILWLTGGPGCSGFNGLALAMGREVDTKPPEEDAAKYEEKMPPKKLKTLAEMKPRGEDPIAWKLLAADAAIARENARVEEKCEVGAELVGGKFAEIPKCEYVRIEGGPVCLLIGEKLNKCCF